MQETSLWPSPIAHLARLHPDSVQFYFSPAVLHATAHRFIAGFAGLVSYAVKANPGEEVLGNLISAGVTAFDVASPAEMAAVRAQSASAVLHYNNPVRSREEIDFARALGVRSFSVDCPVELEKLASAAPGSEISVRLALPVPGAAYDFGSKFGATPAQAVVLLRRVAAMGFTPSMTFHPGTQCATPEAWGEYISACAGIAREAGLRLARLNVGGGFPARRSAQAPDLEAVFTHIREQVTRHFGPDAPALVCEPGRAMVAEAFSIAARVKALRGDGSVFLNDGLYGGLAEARDMEMTARLTAYTPDGRPRRGASLRRVVFGPTCDSVDRLPGTLVLPDDLAEGDYLVFQGMGAYTRCLSTGFNGYGLSAPVTVARL
jgi:ornithine decarboxylase